MNSEEVVSSHNSSALSNMGAAANKQLMQHIFSELSTGNSKPFLESLADDVSWTITGSTTWSKTYHGCQWPM